MKQKDWEIKLEKQIILSLVTAWELGKKQKVTPYKYNLDTKKLGQPIYDLFSTQRSEAYEEGSKSNFVSDTDVTRKLVKETKEWIEKNKRPIVSWTTASNGNVSVDRLTGKPVNKGSGGIMYNQALDDVLEKLNIKK